MLFCSLSFWFLACHILDLPAQRDTAPEAIHSAATTATGRCAALRRPDAVSQWLFPIISLKSAAIQ